MATLNAPGVLLHRRPPGDRKAPHGGGDTMTGWFFWWQPELAIGLAIAAVVLALIAVAVPALRRPVVRASIESSARHRRHLTPPGSQRFIGREAEQARFLELVNNAESGPAMFILSGPTGMGKRALLE